MPSPFPSSKPPRSHKAISARGHYLFPDSVRIPRQKYHPEPLEAAWRSESSATLEGGVTRAFCEEGPNRVLEVLSGEKGRGDLAHPVVGAPYPMLEICAHHPLRGS